MKTLLAAAAVAAALIAVPSTAHAEDQRPCVSKREFNSTPSDKIVTRHQIEVRWDTVGLGHRLAQGQWAYRACGYAMSDVHYEIWSIDGTTVAFGVAKIYTVRHPTLHGHPRA